MQFQYTGAPSAALDLLVYPLPIPTADVVAHCLVPGVPLSKQRPRFVRQNGSVFTPKETRDREKLIGAYVHFAAGVRSADAASAFGLRAVFYVADAQRKDTDNMLKLVMDGLNRVVWADDSQVGEVMGWKREDHDNPRTEIVVYRLGWPAARQHPTCAQCGKTFKTYPSWGERTYCGKRCAAAAARTGQFVACEQCGSPVYRQEHFLNGKHKMRTFCSLECTRLASTVERVCPVCAKTFRMQRCKQRRGQACCSVECVAARHNATARGRSRGQCRVCGGRVSRSEYTRCNACRLLGRVEKNVKGGEICLQPA